MKCKDCQYFNVICQPMGHYESGQARCLKHDLVVDFFSTQKLNKLTCVEEDENEMQKLHKSIHRI